MRKHYSRHCYRHFLLKALEQFNNSGNAALVNVAITAMQTDDNIWQYFNITDSDNAEQTLPLTKQLIQGKHSDYVQGLAKQGNTKALVLVTTLVLDYMGQDTLAGLKMDEDTVLNYLSIAVEHQLPDYYIDTALGHVEKSHPEKIQPWADKLLSKPRLQWANYYYDYNGTRGITQYISLLRRWAQ